MKHNINLKWPYSVEIKQQHWVEQGHINELDLGNKQDCMLVLQATPFAERKGLVTLQPPTAET